MWFECKERTKKCVNCKDEYGTLAMKCPKRKMILRERRQSCAARPREEGRHAVTKIRRAVSMKIKVEERVFKCLIGYNRYE